MTERRGRVIRFLTIGGLGHQDENHPPTTQEVLPPRVTTVARRPTPGRKPSWSRPEVMASVIGPENWQTR
jgi:hypothetical protein